MTTFQIGNRVRYVDGPNAIRNKAVRGVYPTIDDMVGTVTYVDTDIGTNEHYLKVVFDVPMPTTVSSVVTSDYVWLHGSQLALTETPPVEPQGDPAITEDEIFGILADHIYVTNQGVLDGRVGATYAIAQLLIDRGVKVKR